MNPRHEDCVERLRRAVEDDGFAGVKLWMATTCDDERVFPVAEAAIRYNIPILIHCFHKAVDQIYNETLGPHVANLARRYPEAKLIMAHLGGNPYHSIPAIRDCPNVWVDNSHSIFRADELRYTYERLGAGRILFGTDIPGNTWVKYGEVLELPVSEEERKDIFFRNAQRIFDRNYYVSGGKL